jgi:DNA ligase D-like protein (predicted 3'-phosphoesterase)
MPDADQKLKQYRTRRDFEKTPEPGAAPVAEAVDDEHRPRVFVIQKHDATRLHYDFRLEVDGVLKSWAVPKGPALNPADKRLAVMTEDHPLEYASFEGLIPEGEYGGGAVIVWDGGTYRNLKLEDPKHPPMTMAEGLVEGHATVWLEGQKLRGGFALVRTRGKQRRDEENWLLIKMSDEFADAGRNITQERPESILSGKTIEDLKGSQTP